MGGPSGKRSIGFSVNVLAFYGVCIATGRLCILEARQWRYIMITALNDLPNLCLYMKLATQRCR